MSEHFGTAKPEKNRLNCFKLLLQRLTNDKTGFKLIWRKLYSDLGYNIFMIIPINIKVSGFLNESKPNQIEWIFELNIQKNWILNTFKKEIICQY